MLEFLYNITVGLFPYNIGPWTIVILTIVLTLDKIFGENNKVLNAINNSLKKTAA